MSLSPHTELMVTAPGSLLSDRNGEITKSYSQVDEYPEVVHSHSFFFGRGGIELLLYSFSLQRIFFILFFSSCLFFCLVFASASGFSILLVLHAAAPQNAGFTSNPALTGHSESTTHHMQKYE